MDTNKHRIQLDMTEPMRDRIDQLAEETGATTRAEVIRRAISIYGLLIDERKAGVQVELVGKDGDVRRVLLTP